MNQLAKGVLMHFRRSDGRRVAAAAGAVVCLGLAACSSGGSSPSSGAAKSGTPAAGSSANLAGATGTPIEIGFIDPAAQTEYPIPGDGAEAEAAVYYVNHTLGGIKGHPLKLLDCQTDGTPNTNVNCANKFVAAKVAAVIDGFDLSAGSELPILHSAGIPLVGTVPATASANDDPKSFYLGPPDQAFFTGTNEILAAKGWKNINVVSPNSPDSHVEMNTLVLPVAKALGMNEKIIYEPTSPNWQVLAQTMISGNPDVVGVLSASESDCTSMVQAVRAAGWTKPILVGACIDYVAQLPASQTAGTLSYSGTWVPAESKFAPPAVQSQLAAYASASKATGIQPVNGGHPIEVFAAVVNLARILSHYASSSTITAVVARNALNSVNNFPGFLVPNLTCNHKQLAGAASTCASALMLFQVQPDHTLKPVSKTGGFQSVTAVGSS
jgi:branched-chain amino acid transport system substrate-binding protein